MKSQIAGAYLAVFLLGSAAIMASRGAQRPDLPQIENISGFGCDVKNVDVSDRPGSPARAQFWLTVWASHAGTRDFEFQYSRRPKIRQAFEDCGRWAEQVWNAEQKHDSKGVKK